MVKKRERAADNQARLALNDFIQSCTDEKQKRHAWLVFYHIFKGRSVDELLIPSMSKKHQIIKKRRLYQIIREYSEKGLDAFQDKRKKNLGNPNLRGPHKMTYEQEVEFAQKIKFPPPDGGLWTGPKAAKLIQEITGAEFIHRQRGAEFLKKHKVQ